MRLIFFLLALQFEIISGQNFFIKGKVVDEKDFKPVESVVIKIDKLNKATVTDNNGIFIFDGIKPGNYNLVFSHIGFESIEKNIKVSSATHDLGIVLKSTVEDLESVVVTGTLTERKLKETPVLTQSVSTVRLSERGYTSVREALELEVPGLDFNRSQTPQKPAITFQGMEAKYTLILVDGERIAGEANGNIDFSRLNLSNVDHLEVVRGASSVLYGSNAIGGVINIITKKPVAPFEASVMAKYSKFNELTSQGFISLKKEYIASTTGLSYTQTDGYDLTPQTPFEKTSDKLKSGTISQKIVFNTVNNLNVTTRGEMYYNRLYTTHVKPADSCYIGASGYFNATYSINDSARLQVSYAADDYSSYKILVNNSNKYIKTSYDILQSTKFICTLGTAYGTFIGGIEYLPENLLSTYTGSNIRKSNEMVTFVQNEYRISSSVYSVAGIRVTRHSKYGYSIVPKIALMIRHDPLTFRISYGQGYRSPSLKELYYNFNHFGMFDILGNPNLKPEKSNYFGFSAEVHQDFMEHSVNVYFNHINDIISYKWIGSKLTTLANDSSANIIGMDLLEKVQPFNNLTIAGGLSIVDSRNSISGKQLYGFSPVSANITVNYSLRYWENAVFDFNLSGKYNGFRMYEPINNIDTVKLSDNPYQIWRASVTWRIKNSTGLTLGMDNIFNEINPSSFDNNSPGRRIFFTLTYNFKAGLRN
jgi:outer membrane receptor for ferrienterochelin and colicins